MNIKTLEKILENKLKANGYTRVSVGEECEALDLFHAEDVFLVTRDDDYFCELRADHFVVEIGWTEADLPINGVEQNYCVVTANHKGNRQSVIFKI